MGHRVKNSLSIIDGLKCQIVWWVPCSFREAVLTYIGMKEVNHYFLI